MPIRQFLGSDAVFAPEDLTAMSEAFSRACAKLKLSASRDARAELLARRIIRAALGGERDPERLCELALEGDDDKAA